MADPSARPAATPDRRPLMRTLYTRLAVILFGLFLIIGLLYTAWMIRTSQLYLQEVDQKLNAKLAEHLASERILFKDGHINKTAAAETFRTLMVINRNIEIYLLDPDGAVLAYSAAPGVVRRSRVRLQPIKAVLDHAPLPVYGDDPRSDTGRRVFSVTALNRARGGQPVPPDAPNIDGYLYVVLVGDEYVSAWSLIGDSRTLRGSAAGVVALIALGLVATLLVLRRPTRRLTQLAAEMTTFRDAPGRPPVPPTAISRRGDEIDILASTFREMRRRIAHQIERLQDVDRMRRDLVANVSHDLRTPMASVHGYLETLLLKESTLAPPDRRKYLEVAFSHVQSLGVLITELFDLAKLDAREVSLHIEPFSLCELGQDVLQRFELAATAKGVGLQADLGRALPRVNGDIRLIERVLVNLIDNAVRHTPSGGRVSLTCAGRGQDILIELSDTGPGIAAQDLPHLFDRFYRVTDARRPEVGDDPRQGAGLGLAIAQRILDLHGSRLHARSDGRTGAVFSFALAGHAPADRLVQTRLSGTAEDIR